MGRVVIDTDILSDLLKLRNPEVKRRAEEYQSRFNEFSFISLTALEILSGLKHIDAPAKLLRAETLLNENDEILPSKEDYRLGSDILSALWKAGTPIGLVDPMIAACALSKGYGLATANIRHFQYIRDAGFSVQLENWRNPT